MSLSTTLDYSLADEADDPYQGHTTAVTDGPGGHIDNSTLDSFGFPSDFGYGPARLCGPRPVSPAMDWMS
jgi:hypothetical protein